MGRAFQCGLGVGDALLDAAGGEGDEEILRGLRGTYQDFRFFLSRKELIAGKIHQLNGGIAVNVAVIAFNACHIVANVLRGPGGHAGILQRVIAGLLLGNVCIHVDALARDGAPGAIVQSVHAVFIHIGFERLEFIVLTLHFGDELILLLAYGLATAFEDCRITPSQELRLSVLVVKVGVVVVHEGAIGGKSHRAILRNDAVQVQVAAGIGDGNISFRLCLKAVVLSFLRSSLHGEGTLFAGDSAGSSELYPVRCDGGTGLLGNITFSREGDGAAGGDGIGGDAMVHHFYCEIFRRAAAHGLCTGADGCILRTSVAGGGIQSECAGIDIAATALGNGGPRESRCAGAIGQCAIDDYVAAAAFDIECTTGFIANEVDANTIVRFHRILRECGIGFLFHQLVIVFLRQAKGVPQTLFLLGIFYDL